MFVDEDTIMAFVIFLASAQWIAMMMMVIIIIIIIIIIIKQL